MEWIILEDNEDKRMSVMELNLEQMDAWGEESSIGHARHDETYCRSVESDDGR
jgi:hypothetical protein